MYYEFKLILSRHITHVHTPYFLLIKIGLTRNAVQRLYTYETDIIFYIKKAEVNCKRYEPFNNIVKVNM